MANSSKQHRELTISLVAGVHAVILTVTVPCLIDTLARRHTAELIDSTQCRRPHDTRRRIQQLGAPVDVSGCAVLFVGVVVAVDITITSPDQRDTLLIAALPVVVIACHRL